MSINEQLEKQLVDNMVNFEDPTCAKEASKTLDLILEKDVTGESLEKYTEIMPDRLLYIYVERCKHMITSTPRCFNVWSSEVLKNLDTIRRSGDRKRLRGYAMSVDDTLQNMDTKDKIDKFCIPNVSNILEAAIDLNLPFIIKTLGKKIDLTMYMNSDKTVNALMKHVINEIDDEYNIHNIIKVYIQIKSIILNNPNLSDDNMQVLSKEIYFYMRNSLAAIEDIFELYSVVAIVSRVDENISDILRTILKEIIDEEELFDVDFDGQAALSDTGYVELINGIMIVDQITKEDIDTVSTILLYRLEHGKNVDLRLVNALGNMVYKNTNLVKGFNAFNKLIKAINEKMIPTANAVKNSIDFITNRIIQLFKDTVYPDVHDNPIFNEVMDTYVKVYNSPYYNVKINSMLSNKDKIRKDMSVEEYLDFQKFIFDINENADINTDNPIKLATESRVAHGVICALMPEFANLDIIVMNDILDKMKGSEDIRRVPPKDVYAIPEYDKDIYDLTAFELVKATMCDMDIENTVRATDTAAVNFIIDFIN